MFLYCFYLCSQFGEDVSVAPSVALVSERNANQSAPSPQVYPSVSGDQDPAAALWGNQEYTKARWENLSECYILVFKLIKNVVAYILGHLRPQNLMLLTEILLNH